MSEQTYTLAEARRELARQECQRHGHSWDVVSTLGDGPVSIVCGTCGWSGSVTMDQRAEVGA